MAQENRVIKENSQYFEYRLEYKEDDSISGPAEEKGDPQVGSQALKDWNRFKTAYFINEKSVDEIKNQKDFNGCETYKLNLAEKPEIFPENQLSLYKEGDFFYARFNGKIKQLDKNQWDKILNLIENEPNDLSKIISACGAFPFENIKELSEFFEAHLFCEVRDEQKKKTLIKEALRHLHQSGFPTATNFSILKAINKELEAKNIEAMDFAIIQPLPTINFTPIEDGISVKEIDLYEKIIKNGEPLEIGNSGYHLKATTDKDFKIKDNDLTVQMTNISIHCDCSDPLLSVVLNNIEAKYLLEKQSQLIKEKLIEQLNLVDLYNQLVRTYKKVDDEQIKASMVVFMDALSVMNNHACSKDSQDLLKDVIHNTNLLLRSKPTDPEYNQLTEIYNKLLEQVKEKSEKNAQSGFWKQLGGSMLMLLGAAIITAAIVFAVFTLPVAIATGAVITAIAISVGSVSTASVGAYIAYKGGFFAKKGEDESRKSKDLDNLSKSMEEVKENFRPRPN